MLNSKNTIKVKKATLNDCTDMKEIQACDGFEHVYYLDEKRLQRLFHRGEVFFLAYVDDQPVGFSSIDFEIRAKFHFLSAHQNHTRQGVGKSLVQAMIQEARDRNFQTVHTYVELNSSKENFLRKFGFENVGVFRNRYKKGSHASIWQKDLD